LFHWLSVGHRYAIFKNTPKLSASFRTLSITHKPKYLSYCNRRTLVGGWNKLKTTSIFYLEHHIIKFDVGF
jgi:hypothetical protein